MPERVLALSHQVSTIATTRVEDIRRITRMTKILGINAAIEAARSHNPSFAIVADEVSSVSSKIEDLAETMHHELGAKTQELQTLGKNLVARIRGSRLADLALNMIDIIDRNLYERSCDVRWWATDSAVVDCVSQPVDEKLRWASKRLGVILDSYTVYLDLWIVDLQGKVLANGRPSQYDIADLNVGADDWFQKAIRLGSGADFVACDVVQSKPLGNAPVTTYATAIRQNGDARGEVLGVLGVFFDWGKQSQVVVDSVRVEAAEKDRTKCLILSAEHKIIASSAGAQLYEPFPLQVGTGKIGSYLDGRGNLVGFALTPGYETYEGLGWYGAIVQEPR